MSRQIDGKRRALVRSRALGADTAAVQVDEMTDDGEANAEAAMGG